MTSVVPTRSEDELGSTKVTDRTNYTLQSKAQHKDEDDDESVDEFKTDEAVESNATENATETKLVEPEEELYKPYKTNSIESCIETKNIKPKIEKVKSLVLKKKNYIEVDEKYDPKQHKTWNKKYKGQQISSKGQTSEKQEDVGVVYSVRIIQSMDSEA